MRGLVCVLLSIIVATYAAEFIQVEKPIENKYIIVMNDKTSITARDEFLDIVRDEMTRDASNISVINDVFDINTMVGYMATLSPQLLEFHKAHTAIKYVEEDQMMSIHYKKENNKAPSIAAAVVTQTGSTWGLARISRQAASGSTNYIYDSSSGSGVEVWIIDTGVYAANNEFGGRAATVFNAITGETATDLNGHGTHCAGTSAGKTYGVAKAATVKGVKVLDADGSGSNSGVILGVQYVAKNHGKKAVANMSLGGSYSAALNQAVAAVISSGVAFAVAAGNENQNACNTSPASEPTAITVGSITNTNARSSFSNYGSCVDIFAPGSNILSAWIGSPSATSTISGTSMASPHVAGILAQQLGLNPTYSSTTLSKYIVSEATSGQVSSPGTGSPNLIAFSPY